MNLRDLLRQDFWYKIRYNFIKEKCEICGETNNLHLHHVDRFHNLLMETLEELQLNELDTNDYSDFELKCIRNFMIAKQVSIKYKTLCEKCHKRIHLLERKEEKYKDFYYNPYGQYTYINFEKLNNLNIENQYKFRFLLLCCYMKFNDDKMVFKVNNNKYTHIKAVELMELLRLSESETKNTKKALIENGLILIDPDKNIIINREYAFKGFINHTDNYIKIFNLNFINLYNKLQVTKHKSIYNVFIMAGIYRNNIFCDTAKEICNKINHKYHKRAINDIIINSNELLYCSSNIKNKTYYINPKYIYTGELNNTLKDLINKINSLI